MTSAAARVRSALEPALLAAGYDIEDVQVRQAGTRRLVQVVVDRDGGLTLDDVAGASQTCSDVLDAVGDDVLPGAYVLEVTSPGVDRPLTLPRHWRRNVGRLVEARRREGAAITGRVLEADDEAVVLDVAGDRQRLALSDVASGRVQVEFNRSAAVAGDVGEEG